MILVDTSAWIELLRASGHPAHVTLRHHLERRSPIATTEPILMELLAGTRTAPEHKRLRARLLVLPRLAVRGLADFESAADLYRACRGRGATVRKPIDCLIAAVALRERATVLHNDRDFEVLARHTRLRTEGYRILRPASSPPTTVGSRRSSGPASAVRPARSGRGDPASAD